MCVHTEHISSVSAPDGFPPKHGQRKYTQHMGFARREDVQPNKISVVSTFHADRRDVRKPIHNEYRLYICHLATSMLRAQSAHRAPPREHELGGGATLRRAFAAGVMMCSVSVFSTVFLSVSHTHSLSHFSLRTNRSRIWRFRP